MNKFFTVFLFLIATRLFSNASTAEEFASLHGESSALVYDCVNAITGDFIFHQHDCIVKGAEPIYLPRQYISRESRNPQLRSLLINHSRAKIEFDTSIRAIIPEPTGVSLEYIPEEGSISYDKKGPVYTEPLTLYPRPSQFNKGLVHQKNSMYHPAANRAVFDQNTLKVIHSDGSYRVYHYFDNIVEALDPAKYTRRQNIYLLLDHERLPNGNFIRYTWNTKDKTPYLQSMEAVSSKGSLLAKVDADLKKDDLFKAKTSNSLTLEYKYKYEGKNAFLTSVKTPDYPDETLEYNKQLCLRERAFPEGRRLKIKYYDDGKVKHLIGPDQILCSFEYAPGCTTVKDYDGNQTHYYFDPQTLRLKKIEFYDSYRHLARIEEFSWDNFGNLTDKTEGIKPNQKQSHFTYDKQHRLIAKSQIGSITGRNKDEIYTTYYHYNEQNQLIEYAEDNGLKVKYTYLPGVNLPTTKTLSQHGELLKRYTYAYNEDHILLCETLDDGPQFTQRFIKRITPRKDKPFIGLPQLISEYYQEGNQEILLKKTELTYDKWGNATTKTTYDSENKFCYREEALYNSKGQVVKETDRKGSTITYAYDKNGNKIYETSLLGLQTRYFYDKLNNCTRKQEGNETTHYRSFTLSGKPQTIIDPTQGKTELKYDPFGNILSKTDPLGYTTTYSYNRLGQQNTVTDPLGNAATITYNIYDQPLSITHPDGTKERYTYTLNGKKESYIDQNKATSHYEYDHFGNLTTEILSNESHSITLFKRQYSAFHLLEEIDSENLKTTHDYTPSGKLDRKICDTSITTYAYDTLGRCTHEMTLDYTLEKTYDTLDRVVQKKEYSNDQLLTQEHFTYDAASNLLSHTNFPNNIKSTTFYQYDSFGREIAKIDPFEETTTTTYLLKNLRSEKTIQEPLGITISEIFDPLNQLIQIKKLHDGRIIAQEDFTYDPTQNLTSHTTAIYKEGHPSGPHQVSYTYDRMHRKVTETEQSLKTTHYTYTPKGQLSTLIKPDKTTLTYTYDLLGYLQTLTSSDETINYSYTYNTKGQLLSSRDHIHNTQTARIVDPHGNVLEETLANGYAIASTYDPLNRRTSLTLPNQPTIFYTHQGFHLKTISQGPNTHTYQYDLEGNLVLEETFNNDFRATMYDDLGRPIEYISPYFKQTCSYDARGNIIEMEYREQTRDYTYNAYDHLISEPNNTYAYDSLDNRLSKNNEVYHLNTLNQLDEEGFAYDQNGNLTRHHEAHYTYDALGRLIQITTPPKTIYLTYDSEHRCINRNAEKYLWDGNHELGTPTCYRILGSTDNAEIGSATAIIYNDTLYIPTHDLQGHLVHITNEDGDTIESRSFTAFGEAYGSYTIPWGFCSKRHDPEASLIYFGRRYYDSALGRFITPDPEGYTDSYNLYTYCSNNPLTHFDPYGLFMLSSPSQEERYKQAALGALTTSLNYATSIGTEISRYADYSYRIAAHPFQSSDSLSNTFAGRSQYWDSVHTNTHATWQNLLGADPSHRAYQQSSSFTHSGLDAAMLLSPTKAMFKGTAAASNLLAHSFSRTIPEVASVKKANEVFGRIFHAKAGANSSKAMIGNTGLVSTIKKIDFIVGPNGYTIPTSRRILENALSGLNTFETRSPGLGYILPNGRKIRIMEASGKARMRASFTNNGNGPINPFTGKPPQPSRNMKPNERRNYVRALTHIELEP